MLYGYVVMGWPDSDSGPGRFEKTKTRQDETASDGGKRDTRQQMQEA